MAASKCLELIKGLPREYNADLIKAENEVARKLALDELKGRISTEWKDTFEFLKKNPELRELAQAIRDKSKASTEQKQEGYYSVLVGKKSRDELLAEDRENIQEYASFVDEILDFIDKASKDETLAKDLSLWKKVIINNRTKLNEATTPEEKTTARDVLVDYVNRGLKIYLQTAKKGIETAVAKQANPEQLHVFKEALSTFISGLDNLASRKELVDSLVQELEQGADPYTITKKALTQILEFTAKYPLSSYSIFSVDKVSPRNYDWGVGVSLPQPAINVGMDAATVAKKGKPSSIISTLGVIGEYLSDLDLRAALLGNLNSLTPKGIRALNKVMALKEEIYKVIDEQVLHDLKSPDTFLRKGGKFQITGQNLGEYIKAEPLTFLRDKDGRLNDNLVTALAAELVSYIGMQGERLLTNDDRSLASLFQIDESQVTEDHRFWGGTIGTLRKNFIQEVGEHLVKQMHLNFTDAADGTFKEGLQLSLGQLAAAVGQKIGVFGAFNIIPGSVIEELQYIPDAQRETDPKEWVFIKPTTQPIEEDEYYSEGLSDKVKDLVDTFNDGREVLQDLFDIRERVRPHSYEPIGKANRKISGSINESGEGYAKGNEAAQNRGIKVVEPIKEVITLVEPETFKSIFLNKKSLKSVQKTKRKAQEAINRLADRQYEALIEAYKVSDREGNPDIFTEYVTSINNRSMVNSNVINDQASKLHRWALAPSEWNMSVDFSGQQTPEAQNKYKYFMLAVGMGIGIKIDKELPNKSIQQAEQKLATNPYIRAGIDLLRARDPATPFTPEQAQVLDRAIKEAGEATHSLAALVAYADYENHRDNGSQEPYKYTLAIEVDGLTQGAALTFLQMAPNLEFLSEMLPKVGLNFGESTSFAETTELKGNSFKDVYQTITTAVTKVVNTVVSGEEIRDNLEKFQGEKAENARQKYLKKYLATKALKYFLPDYIDVEGKVSKEGRDLAKDPTMQTNYASGLRSTQRYYGQVVIDYFYDQLMKIAEEFEAIVAEKGEASRTEYSKEYAKKIKDHLFRAGNAAASYDQIVTTKSNWSLTKQGKFRSLVQETGQAPGTFQFWKGRDNQDISNFALDISEEQIAKDILDFAREFELNEKVEKQLRTRAEDAYGNALWDGLNNVLGDVWKVRDQFVQATNMMNGFYAEYITYRVDDFQRENGRYPSDTDLRDIIKDIRDIGLLPSYATPNTQGAADYNHMLEITDKELVEIGKEAIQLRIKEPLLQSNNGKPSAKSISNRPQRLMPKKEISVRGYVLGILSIDAAIMAKILEKFNIRHIFDGIMLNPEQLEEITTFANQTFYEINRDYSITEKLANRLLFFEKALKDPKNNIPFELKEKYIQDVVIDEQTGEIYGQLFIDPPNIEKGYEGLSLADYLYTIQEVNAVRRQIFNPETGLQAVNNFNMHGAHYTVPGARPKVLGSSPESVSEAFQSQFAGKLNVETARDLMQMAERDENQQRLSYEHNAQLDKVFEILVPGLARADDFIYSYGLNENGSINQGRVVGNKLEVEASGNALSSPVDMSVKETLVHEYTHVVLRDFLEDKNNYWARDELRKLYERAKEKITWEDFLPDRTNYTQYEESAAKIRYDYIFSNSNGANLHEFAAIGLTNEQFARALTQIQPKLDPEERGNIWTWNPLRLLWNIFSAAMEWFESRGFETKRSQSLHTNLENLVRNISTVTVQRRDSLWKRAEDAAGASANQMDAWIKEGAWKAFETAIGQATGRTWSKDPVIVKGRRENIPGEVEKLKQGMIDIHRETINKIVEWKPSVGSTYADFLERTYAETKGVVRGVKHELFGLSPRDLLTYRPLKLMSNALVDQPRKHIKEVVEKQVRQFFDPKVRIKRQGWIAINEAILRTGLWALSHNRSPMALITLLENPSTITEAANALKSQIRETYGNTGNTYINQAQNLGLMMSQGKNFKNVANPQTNAYNIVRLRQFGLDAEIETKGFNLEQAEQQINELASLYALEYAETKHKQEAARIFRHELERTDVTLNGIDQVMMMQEAFEKESQTRLFEGNPTQMMKGYTSEQYSPNVSVKVAQIDAETQDAMEREGYKYLGPLKKDELINDPVDETMGLYVSNIGIDRFNKAVISLTNLNNRGTTLVDKELKSKGTITEEAQEKIDKVRMQSIQIARKQVKDTFELGEPVSNRLVPILDDTGSIANYRYMMSNEQKINLLKREDLAHEALGRMYSSIQDKLGSQAINTEVVNTLKKEYEEFKDNPNIKFVTISPNDPDKAVKDTWAMLPAQMRKEAERQFGSKKLEVRKEVYNYLMGFREVSATGLVVKLNMSKKLPAKIPLNVLVTIKRADMLWKEAIANIRMKYVLNPHTIVGNMYSNTMLLMADGIPPDYILKKSAEAIHAMRKYQKQKENIDRIINEIGSRKTRNQSTQDLENKLAYLQADIKANPVTQLVEDSGMFPAIVEDIDPESFANQGKIMQAWIAKGKEWASDKGLEKAASVAEEALFMPGSHLFAWANMLNQYGDFMGRYVKYHYDTEVKKRDHTTAVNDALDAFIFYDEPANRVFQTANDYGFLWFHKFYFRIQRIYYRMLKASPARTLGIELLDNATLGYGTIGDYFLSADGLNNRVVLNPAAKVLNEATEPLILDWFKFIF